MKVFLVPALVAIMVLAACSQPAPTPTPAPAPPATQSPAPTAAPSGPTGTTPVARTGTVDVRVTDAPPKDVTKILVTASKIEAQVTGANGESGWRTILEKPPVFDLVALTGIEGSLGTNLLPEGTYQQVRLSVDKVMVTVSGVDKEAEVPSDKLRVVGGFEIAAGKTTVVTLDFDAEKSVVLVGPKVLVKPVVKLLVKQPAEKPEPAKGPLTRAAPSPAATSVPAATPAPTSIPTPAPTPAPSAAEARSELKLIISQPDNESVVSASAVTVKGVTSPDAVVSVNGAVATVAANGTFSQDVTLQPGPNRIEVLASTFDGQSKSQVISLIRLAS